MNNFNAFFHAYLEALIFTECHGDNPELQYAEFSGELLEQAKTDCRRFLADKGEKILPYSFRSVAYDFWLTRNNHGSGFWDMPEIYGEDLAKELTDYCNENFGEFWVYAGDDGLIYGSNS